MTPSFLTGDRQPARLAVARILELLWTRRLRPAKRYGAHSRAGDAAPESRETFACNPIFEDRDALTSLWSSAPARSRYALSCITGPPLAALRGRKETVGFCQLRREQFVSQVTIWFRRCNQET
jgi:hypothetical protein